jgi:NAD(P) transhydrogenase subunit alpha
MKPGSIIVDLAAETGGNCELTQAGAEIAHNGVAILGPVNLASTVPLHASQMYARNVASFLLHVARDGKLQFDFTDDIVRETCVTHGGEVKRAL